MSVMGQGFVSDSEVTYRGKAFPATLVSPDQLTVRITKSDIATTDANSERVVVNPPPGGWTSPNPSHVPVNPKPSYERRFQLLSWAEASGWHDLRNAVPCAFHL